jgi:excisionase family DNA binding protein
MNEAELTLTVTVAAKKIGISTSSAYQLCRAGKFPGALRIGEKRWCISRYQFERWLQGTGEASKGVDQNER